MLVVNHDALAVERLGLERRVGLRRAPNRRARRGDAHGPPLRVARRVDETLQMLGREVGAGGGQSGVEWGRGHGCSDGVGDRRLSLATRTGTPEPARQSP